MNTRLEAITEILDRIKLARLETPSNSSDLAQTAIFREATRQQLVDLYRRNVINLEGTAELAYLRTVILELGSGTIVANGDGLQFIEEGKALEQIPLGLQFYRIDKSVIQERTHPNYRQFLKSAGYMDLDNASSLYI